MSLTVSPGGLFSSCVVRFWSLLVSSGVVLVVACGPGYSGYVIKEWLRAITALPSRVTAVQQGFIMRGRNIGIGRRLPFFDEAQ